MTHSRSPWPEEEETWWDVLGVVFEPLGEVAVYVAACIIGGGLIVASRRTPIIPPAVGIVAVIVSVYMSPAARTGRKWTLAAYLVFTTLATGALAVCAGVLYSGPRLATARARDGLGARATVRRRSLLAMHDARRARAPATGAPGRARAGSPRRAAPRPHALPTRFKGHG
jgi:hypothetical protein